MILDHSLTKLRELLTQRKVSAREIIDEAYQNIQSYQNSTLALITVRDKRETIASLNSLDPSLPLYGLPYTLKDSYLTSELRTTAASKILDDFYPAYDATVHAKLKAAGAILVAKANLDAWGHGASTENSDYGRGKNPWDLSKVVGGSSGGPAASVITRMAAFAIGEDTGGSIRNPSSWNNISGLKVTYGRVSRYGSIAYASSLDTVGPMAKSVADLAFLLTYIAGQDPYDATSASESVPDYLKGINRSSRTKYRIGIPREMYELKGLDPVIKSTVLEALSKLEELGHSLVEIKLPIAKMALAAYYIISPSETSSNLGRFDGIRYGKGRGLFTQETMRRIMIGTYDLSSGYYDAYYRKALKIRTMLIGLYQQAFQSCDVIAMPVNPTMPPVVGEMIKDPLANMLADIYTNSVNIVGSPSLALPSGFSPDGLPIGFQLIGKKFSEPTLLSLGHQYQLTTDWHTHKPALIKEDNA